MKLDEESDFTIVLEIPFTLFSFNLFTTQSTANCKYINENY